MSSKYNDRIYAAAKRYSVNPILIAALMKQESGFDPKAGSGVGAQGLMQFMPSTARSLGIDPWNEDQAIDGGTRHLAALLDRYDNRVSLALAGYNAGTSAVDMYGKQVPPYKETQGYVRSIKAMLPNNIDPRKGA